MIVIARGDPSFPTYGGTGKCKPTPTIIAFKTPKGTYNILTCAKDKKTSREGNHIRYSIKKEGNINVFHLKNVVGEYCIPKPDACHCKTMLDKLLKEYSNIDRIDGAFVAQPFIKGCRCYLGSAARAGFKFVEFIEFINIKKVSHGKIEFGEHNYKSICEEYEKKKSMAMGKGKITKV